MDLLTRPFLDDDEDVATVQEFAAAGARTGASLGARTGPVGAGVGAGFGGAVGYFVGYGVTGVAPGAGSQHRQPDAPDDDPVTITVTDEAED
jgi:phage tail tape-measure protein